MDNNVGMMEIEGDVDMGSRLQSTLEIKHDEIVVLPCVPMENTLVAGEANVDELTLEGALANSRVSQPTLDIELPNKIEDEERFVWPWMGIVVNIPTKFQGGKYSGESGSKLRDQLIEEGFNPVRVTPMWNYHGHSGKAIVEFAREWPDWPAFHNAISFERKFKVDHLGRSDWYSEEHHRSELYGWVARQDDYVLNDIIGEHLRKNADLKTISDIEDEDKRKTNKLVSNLSSVIEDKKMNLNEMASMVEKTSDSLREVIEEKENQTRFYNDKLKNMHSNAEKYLQNMWENHKKLRWDLESKRKQLELHGKELERRAAQSESERMKLIDEREQNAARNSAMDLAAIEEEEAAESFLRLIEQHKKEKEEHRSRIIQLEKERDAKQALELEVEQLKGLLKVNKYVYGDDLDAQAKMKKMSEDLKEKEEELDFMKDMSTDLMVKGNESNNELQDARKILIEGYEAKELSNPIIGLKRMGELDIKPFKDACMKKYPAEEVEVNAMMSCSKWDSYLRETEWHPFKMIKVGEDDKRIIDEDDEKLQELKRELPEALDAIKTALTEILDYNASGGYIVQELWNFRENKKATLKEAAKVVLVKFKKQKHKQ